MKNQIMQSASNLSAVGSLVISATDVESKLNCILIVISIVILCVNFALRVWDRVKDGKVTIEEIKDTIDDVTQLKDDISNEIKKGGK